MAALALIAAGVAVVLAAALLVGGRIAPSSGADPDAHLENVTTRSPHT